MKVINCVQRFGNDLVCDNQAEYVLVYQSNYMKSKGFYYYCGSCINKAKEAREYECEVRKL